MDYEQFHNEKLHVAEKMKLYGGSFINALGKALDHADDVNVQRIKDTWPDEWKKYLEWK